MEDKGLKILMTTDTVGGVWRYSLTLCRALQAFKAKVFLVTLGAWPTRRQQAEAAGIENITLYESNFKLEWMQNPWDDVKKTHLWLQSIYKTVEPDILHFNNYAAAEVSCEAPIITVFHSCVQTWWQAVKGHRAPKSWQNYTQLVKKSLQKSDVVVAPGFAMLQEAKKTYHFSSESKVIYNGCQLPPPINTPKEKIILCIGRIWDEGKNLQMLSQIANRLPWPVYIAGDHKNPDTGKASSFKNVIFLGQLNSVEVMQWMQRAAIFVSPTRYEPFGLAILEAAGNACALVLSDLTGLREIWRDAALFFDATNAASAQKSILQLIDSPEVLKEYSEKARQRATAFSEVKMGESYHQLYRNMLRKQPKLLST